LTTPKIKFDDAKSIPSVKKINFLDKLIDDHYKSFKLDFMYNYMDFFSNKYRVRKRISEELKRKVSIPVK
jgi:hypothetical protein